MDVKKRLISWTLINRQRHASEFMYHFAWTSQQQAQIQSKFPLTKITFSWYLISVNPQTSNQLTLNKAGLVIWIIPKLDATISSDSAYLCKNSTLQWKNMKNMQKKILSKNNLYGNFIILNYLATIKFALNIIVNNFDNNFWFLRNEWRSDSDAKWASDEKS